MNSIKNSMHIAGKELRSYDSDGTAKISKDSKKVLISNSVSISVFDAATAAKIWSSGKGGDATVSEDSKKVAIYGTDSLIRILDLINGDSLASFEGAGKLKFSRDGTLLLAAAIGKNRSGTAIIGSIKIWNIKEETLMANLKPQGEVYLDCFYLSPDNTKLAIANKLYNSANYWKKVASGLP